MSIYIDLRDSIYDSLFALLPTTEIIQTYGNGPEAVTPYVTYDILQTEQKGREYISSSADNAGLQQIISQYETKVRFEFVGKQDLASNFAAAELANDFYFKVDYSTTQENFLINGLSFMRKDSLKRVPKKRETDWYMCYQVDIIFGYQVVARQTVDVIDTVTITGTYFNPADELIIAITDVISNP
jgi:hypothetical protein